MKTRVALVAVLILAATAAVAGGQTAAQFTASTSNPTNAFSAATSFPTTCPTPQTIYLAGFETGALLGPNFGGSEGTPAIDSAVARTGTYSGKVTKDTSGIEGFWHYSTPPAVATFAIRFPTLPTADVVKLMTMEEGSGTQYVALGYESATQRLRLTSSVAESVVASTAIAPGTWYVIDFKVDTTAVPPTASWRIDGVAQGSVGVSLPNATLYVGWGSDVLADVFTMNVDDILMSTDLADYPIGDVAVHTLAPTTSGTHLSPGDFTYDGGSAIDATLPSRLDDLPMDTSTADYVTQSTESPSSYLEVGFADTAETCILGVEALATMRKKSGAPVAVKSSAFDGATETVIREGDLPGQTPIPFTATVQPSAGTWTTSAVNGLVVRMGYASDASPEPYWDAVRLEYAVK